MEQNYVFISHSSIDREKLDRLTQIFRQQKIPYWVAPDHIPAGSNYAREIPKAIRECSVFLLLVSANSQKSIWVEKELDSAICQKREILPVHIDDCPMEEVFQFYLNNVQFVEAIDGIDAVAEKILAKVRSTFEKKQVQENERAKGENVRRKLGNGLDMNRQPVCCEYCGGNLEQTSIGIFKCVSCGAENYDDFRKVRNYLEEAGAATAMEIAKNTGISLKTINHFIREEYLEVPKNSAVRLKCAICGAQIRTGVVCDQCKYQKKESTQRKVHSSLWKR